MYPEEGNKNAALQHKMLDLMRKAMEMEGRKLWDNYTLMWRNLMEEWVLANSLAWKDWMKLWYRFWFPWIEFP